MNALKKLMALSTLAIVGCSSLPPPTVSGLEQSDKITIQDYRPHSESQKELFSGWVTSEAYGTYRVAESESSPSGIRLLAHRAYEKFPELSVEPSIKVLHFAIYDNAIGPLRQSLGNAYRGIIIDAMTPAPGVAPNFSGTDNVPDNVLPVSDVLTSRLDSKLLEQTASEKEYTRAFVTDQENPTKAWVRVIYIDAIVLGQRVASRCVVPPIANKPDLFLIEALDMCISNHLALYPKRYTVTR